MRVLVLLLLVALGLGWARTAQARTELVGPHYYRFDDAPVQPPRATPGEGWRRAEAMIDVPQQGGQSLWLALEIPPLDGDEALDPTVQLPRVYSGYDAYFDGQLIGSDHHADGAGRAFQLLPLPHARGGWLTLHVQSHYSKTGVRGPLHLGGRADHLQALLRRDAPRLIIVVLLFAVGVGALMLAVKRERRAFIGFGVWAICVAGWSLFYTSVRDLLWPDPGLWVVVWGLSLAWSIPSFLLFFNANFRRGERWLAWALWVMAVLAAASSLLLVVRVSTTITNPFVTTMRALTAVVFVMLVVATLRRVREGNREAGILLAGFAVYTVTGLHDVLVSLALIRGFEVWAPWGMLAFVVAGAVGLQQRLLALRRRADRDAKRVAVHARERELMLRDLHDGLGRITTGIALLSEVAKQAPEPTRPLESIATLAREGSDEIRTFMRGLDDGDRNWDALASQLRGRAEDLLAALGGSYRLEVTVTPAAPRPTPYLHVQLLRVHQEAITNALKHATEPCIEATLTVSATAARLVIANDGLRREDGGEDGGDGRIGVDLGRGLTNMRRRCEELGGSLALSIDERAVLELHVPLPVRYALDDDGDASAAHSSGGDRG